MKQVVVKHGGMIRIGETVPGGQPPGTVVLRAAPGNPDRPDVPCALCPQRNHSSKRRCRRPRLERISPTECYLSRFSVVPGKLGNNDNGVIHAVATERATQRHDRRPAVLAAAAARPEACRISKRHRDIPTPGISRAVRLALHQAAQQPYDPYRDVRSGNTAVLPPVREAAPEAFSLSRFDGRRSDDRRGVGRRRRRRCDDGAPGGSFGRRRDHPRHRRCPGPPRRRPHRQRSGRLGRTGRRQGGAQRGQARDRDGPGVRGGVGHHPVRRRPDPDQQPRRRGCPDRSPRAEAATRRAGDRSRPSPVRRVRRRRTPSPPEPRPW